VTDRCPACGQKLRERPRSGRPAGRPRLLGPELLARIRELRETPDPRGRRRTWEQVARLVGCRVGSVRTWYARAKRIEVAPVINAPGEFVAAPLVGSPAPSPSTGPFPPASRGEEPG
jgi:hypothetical protein